MPRKSNIELPSESELWDILAEESQRMPLHYDYLQIHSDIFTAFKELCRRDDIECKWIDEYEQISLTELDARIIACMRKLEACVLHRTDSLCSAVYDGLVINGQPAQADAIFVFGAPSDIRVRKAIELYKGGLADKVIISGHGPFYARGTQSEAERMAKVAICEGVSGAALLLETKAITVPDNVKRTLDLFEIIQFKPKKILIVASPFVLQRCVMDWYKFTPWSIEIIPIASASMSYDLTQKGWTSTIRGIRVILNEYAKLIFEAKMDLLRRDDQVMNIA